MVTMLIVINIVIFLMFGLLRLFSFFSGGSLAPVHQFLYENMALHTLPAVLLQKPWGFLTSIFTHINVLHVLGNMLIFFFFGNLFRSELGDRRVLPLYLISGLIGGIMLVLANNLVPGFRGVDYTAIGASGAVMCFLVASATLMPNLEISLFFILNIRIKWLAMALILIDLFSIPDGNFGGMVDHLTGALFGFIYVRTLQRGTDLCGPLAGLFDRIGNLFTRREKPAVRKFKPRKSPLRVVRNNEPAHASKLDELLDKINEKGYDSLTQEEKQWLKRYSDEK